MKKRRKVILGTILLLEVLTLSAIFTLLFLKGKVTLEVTGTKDSWKDGIASEDMDIAQGAQVPLEPDANMEDGSKDTKENSRIDDNSIDKSGQTDEQNVVSDEGKLIPEESNQEPEDIYDTIVISAAGDVTLGRDNNYGYWGSFDHEFELQNKDYGYFFRNVKEFFEADDLTIVNLETTLTKAEKPAEKKFRFKADPSYTEILTEGSIEVVSIANNHTRDYLEQGYRDTLSALESAEIGYFGYEHKYVTEVRGIKVGILGYVGWESSDILKKEMEEAIRSLRKEECDVVIVMFHWGIERDYHPNKVQKDLAHFVIDEGADLVLGAHPHVLQGIEEYNGKKIVYSLGNFSFGGNKNPSDKDTMVYIHKFNFKNGELISQEDEIVPCRISSVKDRNNYQPTPLTGSEKKRVLNKISENSKF